MKSLPVLVFGLIVLAVFIVAGTFAIAGGSHTAAATASLFKTADSDEVQAGEQVGFTIHFLYTGTPNHAIYIEDDLPTTAGISWTVESFSGATTCVITGTNPPHLECVGLSDGAGEGDITVHIVSPTTPGVCGTLVNHAAAGGQNEADDFADATIVINCPTPTPTPAPSMSPTASPTASPSPTPITVGGGLFGGHDSQGDNIIIIWNRPNSVITIDGFDIPLGSACPGQTDTFSETGIPITGDGSFQKQTSDYDTSGHITDVGGGLLIAQGTITVSVGTSCENTLDITAEEPARALLDGDTDCSWAIDLSSVAGGIAFPQGPTATPTPPPNPNKGITISDVIETLKWVAGFAEDSPPLGCPLLQAAFPTPIPTSAPTPTSTPLIVHLQGDADCSGHVEAEDALEILQFVAGLDQPSCGGVKVGQFFLLDR